MKQNGGKNVLRILSQADWLGGLDVAQAKLRCFAAYGKNGSERRISAVVALGIGRGKGVGGLELAESCC